MSVIKDTIMADAENCCSACAPIKFLTRDLTSDVVKFAVKPTVAHNFPVRAKAVNIKDALKAKMIDVPGSETDEYRLICIPVVIPLHAGYGIVLGKVTSARIVESIKKYHPPLQLWTNVVRYQMLTSKFYCWDAIANHDKACPKNWWGLSICAWVALAGNALSSDTDEKEQAKF